jgi:hypothetical protein
MTHSATTLWADLAGIDYQLRYEQVGPWQTRVLERGRRPLAAVGAAGGVRRAR